MTAARFNHVAVLDIGKTNAKVVVLDGATGGEIAALKKPNRVCAGPPYSHYDIDALWGFMIEALAAFAKDPGFDAISITTHGACAALIDETGELALPVLDYEYEYPQAMRDEYDALRPNFSETGSPRLSGGLNLGAQLHYQGRTFPEAFARVRTILTYPQYWAWRLTGVAANEVTSLGCHTDLWNPAGGTYSSLVDRLAIRDRMAPLRSAFDRLGPLLPAVAERIGLDKPVPVYCGIHDSNASLLPHLIGRDPPFSVVSTGTWVISFASGGDLTGLDPRRDTLANVDAFGRPVASARFMGGREFELLTEGTVSPSPADIERALDGVLEKGVMVLPSVMSSSGPFPGRKAQWSAQPADAAERYAAASLYLALMTGVCLDLIGAASPVVVEGPFSRNELYLRALAAATGREVVVLPAAAQTGTAQGAALLTGLAAFAANERRIAPGLDLSAYRHRWLAALSPPAG